MRRPRYEVLFVALACLTLTGCGTLGGPAADLGLAGAGGVAGYHLADHKIGGAAAGAALGYLGSRVAQSQVKQAVSEAEQRGYDRAMNQAVKQHYWMIQARQRARDGADEHEGQLVPVVVPETTINGVTTNARVEYLRVQ
ncbi:MAG: hypothetical protein ACOZE5_08985 [Verrucomicrobiota bacterium]